MQQIMFKIQLDNAKSFLNIGKLVVAANMYKTHRYSARNGQILSQSRRFDWTLFAQ
jgi:hypothetical protein